MTSIPNQRVAEVFAGYPPHIRKKLLVLRTLIFNVAASTEGVGEIEETLKWGEPAYLTSTSKSGTTVRLAWKASAPTRFAMHFHCQTTLVETFRTQFAGVLDFDGDRSIVFEQDDELPIEALAACVAAALTYHSSNNSVR